MICTVTLNPAIDLFLDVEAIEPNTVLRASGERRRPGGKGLNVSRMLQILEERSVALLAAGQGSGADLAALARDEGLDVELIGTGVSVRTNVHIADAREGSSVKVNMIGEEVSPAVLEHVAEWIGREATRLTAVVLAGSLPPGLPKDAWAVLVRAARDVGLPGYLDTSGQELAESVAEAPECIKINRTELQELLGRDLVNAADQIRALKKLQHHGVVCACMTDGAEGTVLVDETGVFRATSPVTTSKRPVGAGDSFMAGLVHARLRGLRGAGVLKHAVAAGTAWAIGNTGKGVDLKLIEEIMSGVDIVNDNGND